MTTDEAFDAITEAIDPVIDQLSAEEAIEVYERIASHAEAMARGIRR